ncbi:MAG: hypothetical protein AAGD05_09030 [Bacteroidota bacterium]
MNPSVLRRITGVNPTIAIPEPPDTDPLKLTLSPNPTTGPLKINYRLPDRRAVTFLVYNHMGQLVDRYEMGIQNSGDHQMEWSSSLPMGVYEWVMIAEEQHLSRRFALVPH